MASQDSARRRRLLDRFRLVRDREFRRRAATRTAAANTTVGSPSSRAVSSARSATCRQWRGGSASRMLARSRGPREADRLRFLRRDVSGASSAARMTRSARRLAAYSAWSRRHQLSPVGAESLQRCPGRGRDFEPATDGGMGSSIASISARQVLVARPLAVGDQHDELLAPQRRPDRRTNRPARRDAWRSRPGRRTRDVGVVDPFEWSTSSSTSPVT